MVGAVVRTGALMICRICGKDSAGQPFDDWVKKTFTNWDDLLPGDIICENCLFWFDERSEKLARRVGKDKPQRMRNYSHFVVNDEWIPLSKGDKVRMQQILLGKPFPELAVVAQSGQKHIAFRARRNPPGSRAGWVQFEEDQLWVNPDDLRALLSDIEALYVRFSKSEIATGNYKHYRILKFGFDEWNVLERKIRDRRGSLLFELALFLAQNKKGEQDGQSERASGRSAVGNLARNTCGLQEPLSAQYLGSIREPSEKRGVHIEPGRVRQLNMFEISSGYRKKE